ncbi:hypothetical protein EWM64_g8258 [Hericium alpestre]|uniref:Prolyl 4-hydroxylase alpha subunit Fe(2+) 2OG dioxygenase domain-containing protein n=1 Tax=Hericium alpestre TaxID=135208 RepID=A0A4Y9ZNB5_9AGAM|nr:hypothetical protein EWM64_g8258 [Hericium alpestre]
MSETVVQDILKPLRDSVVNRPPYVSGILPMSPDHLRLYYDGLESACAIDFTKVTDMQLAVLARACQPATFGLDQKDVFDESYRKAGKMDVTHFSTPIVPERTDLPTIIRYDLLDGENSTRPIRFELYKLNVYGEYTKTDTYREFPANVKLGKGSFFKPHIDTPRSETMFGSLVLVYATEHEDGILILRHRGEEWTFDSAQAVKNLAPSDT